MKYTIFESSLGPVMVAGNDGFIEYLFLQVDEDALPAGSEWHRSDDDFVEAKKQILAYLNGDVKEFSLTIRMNGTSFQQQVWNALLSIPYGQVTSYKEIAETIGVKNGARAVGMANRNNPLPLLVPCHRVIGANGKLTGYAYGLEIKKRLLALEGVNVSN